jgi:hypothetical protein
MPSDGGAGMRDPRPRDVRAADLQEKPTERTELGKPRGQSFRRVRRRRRLPANIAASEASHRTQRALASGAIKNVVVLWVALVRLDASVDRSRYG